MIGLQTQLSLTNQCMRELGRNGVVQPSDDEWAQLIYDRLPYDLVDLLAMDEWWFQAKYYQTSSPDVTNPSPDWQYAFTMPPDFIKMINPRSEINYWIMGRKILVNQNFIQYYYVAEPEDFSNLPWWFCQCLVFLTCAHVCAVLTQNADMSSKLMSQYLEKLSNARMQNAMQVPVWASPYNPYDRGNNGNGGGSA